MDFSIKKILPLWILFFTCSFLNGAETLKENLNLPKYKFYPKEDCIKVKIVFPVGMMDESTLYRINNPYSKGVAVRIKNNQLKCLETFYQLVDIEVYAVPCQEERKVMFEIKENLERKPTVSKVLRDTMTNITEYIVTTDKEVDFRNDVLPHLTFIRDSPNIKYLKFYTKP